MKSAARVIVFTIVMFASIMAAGQAPQTPPARPAVPPVPPAQTVTPKQPYDSAKALLANEKQKNFQLQYKEATAALQAQGQGKSVR